MKKFNFFLFVFSLAGAILFMNSCEKEKPVGEEDSVVSVLATLENGRIWNSGDEVVINGVKYMVESGGESTVTIDGVASSEIYNAAYVNEDTFLWFCCDFLEKVLHLA